MSGGLFSHVLRAVERGAFPRTRKWAWRGLYNMLSRVWRDDDWRFMNYGYVAEGEAFALDPDEEPERPFIGLYHQAVNGLDLEGRDVLEVGSGRGGGETEFCSMLHKYFEVRHSTPTIVISKLIKNKKDFHQRWSA